MAYALTLQTEHEDFEALGPPFYFMTADGEYTGLLAVSLLDFLTQIKTVDSRSLVLHLSRRDFQRWIRDRWHLDALVADLDLIRLHEFTDECLRQQLIKTLTTHYTHLHVHK